jgi:alpha-beta hydrolase superfamily lysophospholipase
MKRRILIFAVLAAAAAVGAVAVGVGWYYADEIESAALTVVHAPPAPDMKVLAFGDVTVTLGVTDRMDVTYGDWWRPGTWGLQWEGGYAQVTTVLSRDDDRSVVRELTPVSGQLAVGEDVLLDRKAFDGDPLTARHLPFEEVTFPSELGPLGAWRLSGSRSTWAIYVHGHRATRISSLRVLPTLVNAGLPTLVIQYRNDDGVAPSASGHYDFGLSEWRDLEAAVRYALGEGASDVVLIGPSMGGGIIVNFLYRSALAEKVRAAILEAPMLDFGAVIDFGAERRNLPPLLTWLGKTVAAWRFGIDWKALDYVATADRLHVPILLFHGDADRTVPIRTSDALAAARPDIVTYVRLKDVTHAAAWNSDPAAYKRAVSDFLKRTLN